MWNEEQNSQNDKSYKTKGEKMNLFESKNIK